MEDSVFFLACLLLCCIPPLVSVNDFPTSSANVILPWETRGGATVSDAEAICVVRGFVELEEILEIPGEID